MAQDRGRNTGELPRVDRRLDEVEQPRAERRGERVPDHRGRPAGRGWTIAAWASAVAAIFYLPLIFGALGMILGYVAYRRGDPQGRIAAIAAGAAMLVGFVLGYLVLTNLVESPAGG